MSSHLYAVQSAPDALLAAVVVGVEGYVYVAVHTAVDLRRIDDLLHVSVYYKRRAVRFAAGREDPMPFALGAEGLPITGPGTVAVVDTDRGHGRTLAVPFAVYARFNCRLNRRVNLGLCLRVRLGHQHRHAVLRFAVGGVERGLRLEQGYIGCAAFANCYRHCVHFRLFLSLS